MRPNILIIKLFLLVAYSAPSRCESAGDSLGRQFQIGAGVGAGLSARVCPECQEPTTMFASGVNVRVGFRFDRWAIALEATLTGRDGGVWENGSKKTENEPDNTYWNHLMLIGEIPVWENLFVKAGAGISFYSSYDQHALTRPDYPTALTGQGFPLAAGVGYDIWVSRSFIVTPAFVYYHAFIGPLELNSFKTIDKRNPINEILFTVTASFGPRF